MLREGWLNRQLDQVSQNVKTWPDWMKRAGGLNPSVEQSENAVDEEQKASPEDSEDTTQGRLRL